MKPKKSIQPGLSRFFLTFVCGSLLTTPSAVAADLYWDGATASWNNIANWSTVSGATEPNPLAVPGASDNAIFNITTVNGAQSVTLGDDQSATGITFNNTGTTTLLGGGTAHTLNLGSGGITIGASAGAVTFGNGTAGDDVLFNLTRAQTWTNHSAAAFTLNNTTFSARTAGSTLNFAGAGTFSANATGFPNDSSGFSGPWAFIGTGTNTRYAFNDAGIIAGYTGATVVPSLGSIQGATTNYENSQFGTGGITANRTANTIRHVGNGSSATNYRFDTSDRSLTLNGLLNVSGATLTISAKDTTITGSQVVIGSSNELILAGSHPITISVPVTGVDKSVSINTDTVLSGANTYSGGTYINSNFLQLNTIASAGTGAIHLGNGSADAELRLNGTSTNPTNNLIVNADSTGTKTLTNRGTASVTYAGNITADDNLTILGAYDAGRLTVNGTANTIAAGKNVSFSNTGAGINALRDWAIWSGDGSISYTSSSAIGFEIRGASTYSGGATLGAMSGTGIVEVRTSSIGPANATTSGAFGTGTLSIGATQMRADITADITIGNAITFTANPTFTTVDSEKSLIFSGNASLGATRTLTVQTGSTVATAAVEISGEISGSGFGIDKQGAGRLVLSGTNTYSGATTVSAGTLVLQGGSQASPITVQNGATLGFDIAAPTTSTKSVTLDAGHKIRVNGSPIGSSYTLLTTSATITGAAPNLDPAIPGYNVILDGTNTLKLVTTATNTFANWIGTFSGLGGLTAVGDDPDGDGIDNGVENFFGTNPGTFSQGLLVGVKSGNTFTFTHPQNATPASDLTASYSWSKDLATFLASGANDGAGTTVAFTTQANTPSPGVTTVTATVTGTATSKLFVRVNVTQP
jgi:autotransporter-associated beta strand protein